MWNSLTVSYVALVVLATLLIGGGAIAGVRMAWRWPSGAPEGEERDAFDRRHHLVVTLVWVGTIAALLLSPLWFWALASLVPAIEGGMCLASVHHLGAPGSYIASALKAIVPALLVYWLVVDRADRRSDTEALLHTKLQLLVPVGLAAGVSALFDLRFFSSLELGPSPCCMTLFSGASTPTAEAATGFLPAYLFAGSLGLLLPALAATRAPNLRRAARIAVYVLTTAVAVTLVTALHTALGTRIMGYEHHCLFCVWKNQPSSFLATFLVLGGAWLVLARTALSGAQAAHAGLDAPPRLALPLTLILAGGAIVAWLFLTAG